MNLKKMGFYTSLALAAIAVFIGFFGLADLIQWVVQMPDSFTYWTFNNRIWLMTIIIIGLLFAGLMNWKYKYLSKKWMGGLLCLYFGLFMAGFIAPTYIMFRSEHYSADYLTIDKVSDDYLSDEDEVLVLVKNGDARAYPNKRIVQTHIAGDVVGGEKVVMSYCGLSHVGQAYSSNVEGGTIDLKVMTQLKNNLVMFDANSQEPVHQVHGKLQNTKRTLDKLPSIVMPYQSFKNLYPKGKVYHYTNNNFIDKMVYIMLDHAIYGKGGQYDKATPNLSFPSITHVDNRLHSKEQVYGVDINGKAIAYTKEYLIKNGGVVVETVGGKDITVKYFEDLDFVNVFYGNVPEVTPTGLCAGIIQEAVPHYNRMLWKVWANFFNDTEVR